MATASAGITFNATAVNRTGRVFREITSQAMGVGKKIAAITTGFAVAGAAAIVATAKALGNLSDVAMRAGASTEEITKMSLALDVLGVKASSPDQIAMAFQRMAKATGETGVEGFKKVIGAISQMESVEQRSAAAMGVFGRAGLEFMPLIEAAAKNGTAALNEVIDTMPGVSDAAADAGDRLTDGMNIVVTGIKDMWMEFVGDIAKFIDSNFEGGIRQASLNAVAYIEYFVKKAGRVMSSWASGMVAIWNGLGGTWQSVVQSWGDYLVSYFKAIGNWIKDVINVSWDDIKEHGVFGKANEKFAKTVNDAADALWEDVDFAPFIAQTDDLEVALQEKLVKAAKGAAAISSAAVKTTAGEAADNTATKIEKAARAMRNEFTTADSYRAATMSIRADYAKGEDKTIKAVNAVKTVNEKIQKACESTAASLAEVGVAS